MGDVFPTFSYRVLPAKTIEVNSKWEIGIETVEGIRV